MFLKRIPEQFHKIFYPSVEKQLAVLHDQIIDLIDDREESQIRHQRELDKISHEAKQNKLTQPALADLMRENLALVPINFSNVPEDGIPKHFLDVDNKDKHTQYINELHQIFQLEVFNVMCQNHIDTQGNFSFRTADGELQMLAGRMSVNGISLIRNDVKKGHEEYVERSNPANKDYADDDDERFEVGEGITIINNQEEIKK